MRPGQIQPILVDGVLITFQHIVVETKWLEIYRRYFQTHAMFFYENNFWYFVLNFTEVCLQLSNGQWAILGSGNGLAPNRRQAITWTNDDQDPLQRILALR